MPDIDLSEPTDTPLPHRGVTRDQFAIAAYGAGWQPRTVELFLRPGCPVRAAVKVAGEMLTVIDWGGAVTPIRARQAAVVSEAD